jgi:hypothetical protein
MGVHGTRDLLVEQVDPLLYAVTLGYRRRGVSARVVIQGQHDTRSTADYRGTEDLSELRFELEGGRTRFVRLSAFRGWAVFSPDFGLSITTGVRF